MFLLIPTCDGVIDEDTGPVQKFDDFKQAHKAAITHCNLNVDEESPADEAEKCGHFWFYNGEDDLISAVVAEV